MIKVVEDVIALAVPEAYPMGDPEAQRLLPEVLNDIAIKQIERQYVGRTLELEIQRIDFLITTDPAQVELWQPAHDCAACRAGNDQSLAFLKANPGRYIALGNLTYEERWPDD